MKIPNIFVPEKDLNQNIETLLNTKSINDVAKDYKEFYGRPINQMPLLVAEGRVPLSVSGLMQKRMEVLDSGDQELISYWWANYFDTGDAVFYHPNGNLKVVLNAKPMKKLNPKSELSDGALVLPKGLYDKLNGDNFTREEIEKYGLAEKLLTKEEAKKNPIWKALAGGDQALLDTYVDAVFTKVKEDYGYDKLMKIWLSQPQEATTGRLWCVGRFNDYGSDANGVNDLVSSGRLVGVAPEAP